MLRTQLIGLAKSLLVISFRTETAEESPMKSAIDRRQFGIGGLAAGALAARSPALAQSAPLKIRVGWVVVPASTAPLVLEKKELLTHFGRSYVAEATRFEGTPPVITALAAGGLPIAPTLSFLLLP